jgi:general secretion pathway protein M
MKEWFASLEQRERHLVTGGAVLLGLMLMYLMVWEPLTNTVDKLRVSTTEQGSTLQWMRQAAQEVKKLRGSGSNRGKSTGGQSLLSVIDRTAKSGRLGAALKRVQPDGEKRVRVWMEAANFDDVIRWLVLLDTRYGVSIENSVFEVKQEPGRVDARLVFEAAT